MRSRLLFRCITVLALAVVSFAQDLRLNPQSQTVESLAVSGFDFAPADRHEKRSADGFYHTGDLRFAVRKPGEKEWKWFSTATKRGTVTALTVAGNDIAAADLASALPPDSPLAIIRTWTRIDGKLVVRFALKNKAAEPLEIGALGFALSFNNILTDRSLAEAHEKCSFSDPYIGADAGYVQVTRLKGNGPALVVVPDGRTSLEAWNVLTEPMRVAQTFEGTFEWLAHTRALADTTWKSATPWNEPTSKTLAPGETADYGLKFLVAPEIRAIEKTIAADKKPVAVGIPGYILPADTDGKLFINYASNVAKLEAEPRGSLVATITAAKGKWQQIAVRGRGWGRARLTITYVDGKRQTVHYYLTKTASSAVADLGRFLFSKQWFDDRTDPFRRAPSVISYDRETDSQVTQDNRVWIAGLGDEAGSGSWLAAAVKQEILPEPTEVAKLERFIDQTLWGKLQYKDGLLKFGVRKSLFYYAPAAFPSYVYDKKLDWTTWASWKKDQAESVGRAYNYPHVVAAYLALYRIARNTRGVVKNHPWDWYLTQAAETTKFLFSRDETGKRRVEYAELGLMEGTVFLELLRELKREGHDEQATAIESLMKERVDLWAKEEYPFGSEMAWDSTGQEEVYAWCKYFGVDEKALVSLDSIVGYMPTVPHWGYNGNARRYWDFLYGGKLRRIERQLHHYGSGLNAIPVLAHYRENPDDFYLLRIGYGGAMGALSNIDRDGFASAAFHSYPDTLRWDAYSGDYGPNFFGYALNSATYIVNHPEFGWQAFGGNPFDDAKTVTVTPKDAVRRRVFIAPLGLWLTLDAGRFERIAIAKNGKSVRLFLSGAANEENALLRIERTVKGGKNWRPKGVVKTERESFRLPFGRWIEVKKEI